MQKLSSALITNLFPSFTSAIIITITCTAAMSLIFTGDLQQYLPLGVGCALIGAIIVNFFNSIYSVFPFAIASVTPNASIILAAFFQSIANVPMSPEEQLYTVIATIIVCNIITAIVIFLWGQFRCARLIRYMPYPVLSGFYAGVGGFLMMGAFIVMTGEPFSWQTLFNHDIFVTLIPMIVFTAILYVALKRYHNSRIFLTVVAIATLLFYAILYVQDIDPMHAANYGLLFKDFKLDFIFHYVTSFSDLKQVQFHVILQYWYYIPIAIVVNLLTVLIYATNFEAASKIEVDINRESKFAGIGNLLASALSGITTVYTTQSMMHKSAGGNHPISIAYVGGFCLFILLFSQYIFPFIPKFIIAGILLLNGIFLIEKWLFKTSRKVMRLESGIIIVIFFLMVTQGLLEGVFAGVLLAFILFIFNYSRISIIHHAISGRDFMSNTTYAFTEAQKLKKEADKIYIIKLSGYLFFGSAERLFDFIKETLNQETRIKYLVIDMSIVDDIDSTTIASIIKILYLLEKHKARLLLTALSENIQHHLGMNLRSHQQKGTQISFTKISSHKGTISIFQDLDSCLRWCEHKILGNDRNSRGTHEEFNEQLKSFLHTDNNVALFMSYLKFFTCKTGECIANEGGVAEDMFLIVDGHLDVIISNHKGQNKRLRHYGPGAILGEMGLFSQGKRQASIVCTDDCSVYRLSYADINNMKNTQPQIAILFLSFLLQIMADRVIKSNCELTVLNE